MIRKICSMALFSVLLFITGIQLTGCSPGKEIVENDTEIRAEEEWTSEIKEIQLKIPGTGRSGKLKYQIRSADDAMEDTIYFEDSGKCMYGKDANGKEFYAAEKQILYLTENSWRKESVLYENIWNLVYKQNCILKEEISLEEDSCYHLRLEGEEQGTSVLTSIMLCNGYKEIIFGEAIYDFYVEKETCEIKRMDVVVPFLADCDDSGIQGNLEGSFLIESTEKIEINIPDMKVVDEKLTHKDYDMGTIRFDQNIYRNPLFDLQIYGNKFFHFDEEKTRQLQKQYEEEKAVYREEGYGQGDGIILNVSSKPADEEIQKELENYLCDSNAESVKYTGEIQIGRNLYKSSSATINGTKTKTYAAIVDEAVLYVTLYYNKKDKIAAFEKCLYSMEEFPLWKAEKWILGEKFRFVTPEYYTVSKKESNSLYLCMESDKDAINIFAIRNSSIEDERMKETDNRIGLNREIVEEKTIPFHDTELMTYIVVRNQEKDFEYFTYIGLVEKEDELLKLYIVRSENDTDYSGLYQKIMDSLKIVQNDKKK